MVLSGITKSEHCRFDAARKLGADHIVSDQKEDLAAADHRLTDGLGAEVVIETSSAPAAIAQCADLLKKNGRLIGMSLPSDKMIQFPWKDAVLKSLEIYFSMSTSYTSWDKVLCLLEADAEKLQHLITWTVKLDDWQAVFASHVEERDNKAVFKFD